MPGIGIMASGWRCPAFLLSRKLEQPARRRYRTAANSSESSNSPSPRRTGPSLQARGTFAGNGVRKARVTTIYKICPAWLWTQAQRAGVFRGMPVDHRDGYIHFSTRDQVAET